MNWLDNTDKILHASASLLIVLALAVIVPPGWAVVLALLIGAAKELVWDLLLHQGDPSWLDFAADAAGAALGAALLLLFG